MKKVLSVFLFLFILVKLSPAQVDDIQKRSEDHKKRSEQKSNSENQSHNRSSDRSNAEMAEQGVSCLFSLLDLLCTIAENLPESTENNVNQDIKPFNQFPNSIDNNFQAKEFLSDTLTLKDDSGKLLIPDTLFNPESQVSENLKTDFQPNNQNSIEENGFINQENLSPKLKVDSVKPAKQGYFYLMPHFAYNPDRKYFNSLIRLGGGQGRFSTDLRFNHLQEKIDGGQTVFNCIEWQILQYNLSSTENFSFKIGTGMFYDQYSDIAFHEHSLMLGFTLPNPKFAFNIEGRYSPDYKLMEEVFAELNLLGSYCVLESKNVNVSFVFGAIVQRYYKTVGLNSIQAGLTLNIH
jgi:hypothetical protein